MTALVLFTCCARADDVAACRCAAAVDVAVALLGMVCTDTAHFPHVPMLIQFLSTDSTAKRVTLDEVWAAR